jgi:prolyl oligopeptidase
MNKSLLFSVILSFPASVFAQQGPSAIKPSPVTEEFFGMKITDPYRNIENLDDPEVAAWMKAQSEFARETLNAIPGRQKLIEQMVELDGRVSDMVRRIQLTKNDRYFYYKTRPEDEQPKLYYREGFSGKEVLLFDPENYEKGVVYAINDFSPSWDGSKIAFSISQQGIEIGHTKIIEVKTGQLYPEKIEPTIGGVSWLADNNHFTYTPLNSMDVRDMNGRLNTESFIHRTGTPQSQDKAVFSAKLYPELNIKPEESPGLFYDPENDLIYGVISNVDNRLHGYYANAADLQKPRIAWKPLFKPEMEALYLPSGNSAYGKDSTHIYFSSIRSGKQEILRMPVADPNEANAEVWIPAGEGVITELATTKDGLFFVRSNNGVSATLHFMPQGSKQVEDITLPLAAGNLSLQTRTQSTSELWVYINGWTSDWKRYRYDRINKQFHYESLSSEAQFPEFNELVVEELMVPSHDGVMVPLSLIYKKGTPRDGTAPVMMEGYGSYGISLTPFFFPPLLVLTSKGGILAVAHVRGGGELGEEWHRAGMKTTKPNTWKDMIACAEYLVKNKYTSPQKLAITGASAGGVLIGRAMTERPDLFAAALPSVGAMNTLRMEFSPNGPGNIPEFGTLKDSVEFKALLEMDAYHNLKEGVKYPATLVTAGINDPRVIAWEPAKFAARLQAVNASDKPILFFTDFEAGHGMGNSKFKQFESLADMVAFSLWQTGHPDFQHKKP